MTNLCCETTARSAFVKDYDVIFLSDGTATASKEMHNATLLNLVCSSYAFLLLFFPFHFFFFFSLPSCFFLGSNVLLVFWICSGVHVSQFYTTYQTIKVERQCKVFVETM